MPSKSEQSINTTPPAGMVRESSTSADHSGNEQAAASSGRQLNTEFCRVGGTYWAIRKDTIDEMTGWEMLEIFNVSSDDYEKLERIR
ncbi:hypothetical protein LTR86_000406 [Recurvomyces mirabilis]|nr:hypothetical protein LTR86_000406 [Recurvomyces mirabilis]